MGQEVLGRHFGMGWLDCFSPPSHTQALLCLSHRGLPFASSRTSQTLSHLIFTCTHTCFSFCALPFSACTHLLSSPPSLSIFVSDICLWPSLFPSTSHHLLSMCQAFSLFTAPPLLPSLNTAHCLFLLHTPVPHCDSLFVATPSHTLTKHS